MRKVHRFCPVCASTMAGVLHHQRFALPPTFDIVACPVCDCVYVDTSADAAAYDRHYTDHSKCADQCTSTGGGDSCDQARIDATAAEIARHLPDKASRIVDIGYSRLLGIDPSPQCVGNPRRLFDILAQQSWLGVLPAEAAPADLIILSHVF